MAAARLNVPSVFHYGGSILPGRGAHAEALDIVQRLRGGRRPGRRDPHRCRARRSSSARACPTIGSCAGMFTANTMAAVSEALGMALPGSASPPAVDRRRDDDAYEAGPGRVRLLELGIRPRQILTKEAFENAIAVVMALGGSTNAVLHLLAIAHEAQVGLDHRRLRPGRRRVPHIADTKPHGRYHMARHRPHRRGAGRAAGAARRRPPARRVHDGHRPHPGREPRTVIGRRLPTVTSSTRSPAHPRRGWYRHPAGLAGARRSGGESGGPRRRAL